MSTNILGEKKEKYDHNVWNEKSSISICTIVSKGMHTKLWPTADVKLINMISNEYKTLNLL